METEPIFANRIGHFIGRLLAPQWRLTACVLTALLVTLTAMNGGCASNGTTTPSATPTPTPSVSPSPTGPTPTPTAPPQNYVSMVYTGATPTTAPTFGTINGYGKLSAAPTASPATTAAPSQVITLPMGQTVVFLNFDGATHTASLLMPENGVFPSNWNNVNGASARTPALQAITSPQFSTGQVTGGRVGGPTFSLMYTTGSLTGMFLFGDFYCYFGCPSGVGPPMRTIIIIQ